MVDAPSSAEASDGHPSGYAEILTSCASGEASRSSFRTATQRGESCCPMPPWSFGLPISTISLAGSTPHATLQIKTTARETDNVTGRRADRYIRVAGIVPPNTMHRVVYRQTDSSTTFALE